MRSAEFAGSAMNVFRDRGTLNRSGTPLSLSAVHRMVTSG
jgi:hypothetical protein